jgi:ribosomal protein L11 methyltransferase
VAQANVQANRVQDVVTVELGSLDRATGKFELVLVNILAQVIIEMAEQGLADRLQSGGLLVTAGFIEDQEAGVRKALQAHGVDIIERRQEKDWVSLIFRPVQT